MRKALILAAAFALAQAQVPAPVGGDASNMTVKPTGTTTARKLSNQTADTVSLLDFGAVCDGTTDDSAAVTAALATHKRITVPGTMSPGTPTVCNAPSILSGAMTGAILIGPGVIKTSEAKKRGAIVAEINQPPASNGLITSVVSAFDGDVSKVARSPVEHRVTGATTAGTPGTPPSYIVQPEVSADWIVSFNQSGTQTGDGHRPFGRTGVPVRVTAGTNAGLGDHVMNWVACSVSGKLVGATTWTGASECGGFAGSMASLVDGAYLQPIGDLDCNDNGFDVSCIGMTQVFNRTNNTAALGNPWIGSFMLSNGTKPIDAAYSATGPMTMTYDCYDSGVSQALPTVPCLVMQAGMRIYGNATSDVSATRIPNNIVLGGEYLQYDTVNGWGFYKAGVLQMATGGTKPSTLPVLLGSNAVQVSHTGDTAEFTFATVTIPANAMGLNGRLQLRGIWSFTGSTNAKTARARLGGVGGTAYIAASTATATNITANGYEIIANRNAANSQVSMSAAIGAGQIGFGTTALITSAIDTTAPTTVVFTGQLTNAGETIALESYDVTLLP